MQAIKHEIKKLSSLFIFFFIGFSYILVLMKLFLKEYSIDVYVFTKAIVGALIAAKAVAIMDSTPLMNLFERRHYPRYLSVLHKTFLYTLAVLAIAALEHLIEAYHRTKAIGLALESFLNPEHFYRILAVTLCVSIVFLIHNIWYEIDDYLGKGTLKKLFFNPR
jgi:hypothetical protein